MAETITGAEDAPAGQVGGAVKAAPSVGGFETQPVSVGDIGAILKLGVGDFLKAPGVSLAIASIYTLGGWLLMALLVSLDMPFLVYPLAMGFALIAPFVAGAFYDVSRKIERFETPTFAGIGGALRETCNCDLRWMALITSFSFFIWMDIAAMLTLGFFGAEALDPRELVGRIATTEEGLVFLIVGHAVGAVIAMLVFSISVITYPLLFDREDVDVMTAIITSVRLVSLNPVAMGAWCVTIAALMGISIASGFLLLPLVLPLLGYASWHLYRRAVVVPEHASADR